MKPKNQSNLSRILDYAGGYKNLTLLGCILSSLSAVLGLIPYVCVWMAARNVLEVWPALEGVAGLARWGWTAVWTAVGSIALYFTALMSTHIAAFRTARNIRHTAMAHVLQLPLGFITGNQSGRLRKLIDDNAGLTEDLLAHKLPDLAGTIITPVAAIVMLFLFDWKMGLLCLLTMVLALFSMCLMMGGKNAGFFHRYQKEIERMSGEAVEYVRGIPVVKMFQQRPCQPVCHELPSRADLFPDFYQRSLCPADSCGTAACLRRECPDGTGKLYLLCSLCSCLRSDDQPDHVHERSCYGSR